jgi:hypothetical protein
LATTGEVPPPTMAMLRIRSTGTAEDSGLQ